MPGHCSGSSGSRTLLIASALAVSGLAGCTSSAPKSASPPVLDTVPVASATEPPPPPPPPAPAPTPTPKRAKPPVAGDRASPPQAEAPEFPWPPPQPSDLLVIPRRLLVGADTAPTLTQVDARLSDALGQAGYTGSRYYAVPEGFALVTRLERIDEHANPRQGDARWATAGLAGTSLIELLKGLFRGNPGRYRVFVFTATSRAFAPDTTQATRSDAERWLRGGMNALPSELGAARFSSGHVVTALLYEFEQRHPDDVAALQSPATVPARTQLERARIWRALGGSP